MKNLTCVYHENKLNYGLVWPHTHCLQLICHEFTPKELGGRLFQLTIVSQSTPEPMWFYSSLSSSSWTVDGERPFITIMIPSPITRWPANFGIIQHSVTLMFYNLFILYLLLSQLFWVCCRYQICLCFQNTMTFFSENSYLYFSPVTVKG